MVLTINNKDYLMEYSIEASLYSDCIQTILNFMLETASENQDPKEIVKLASDLPHVAVTLFYAGLLEHYGMYGDRTIRGMGDAKALLSQYFKENPDATYYSLIKMALEQMGEDGFFQRTGLEEMIAEAKTAQTETEEATPEKKSGRGKK